MLRKGVKEGRKGEKKFQFFWPHMGMCGELTTQSHVRSMCGPVWHHWRQVYSISSVWHCTFKRNSKTHDNYITQYKSLGKNFPHHVYHSSVGSGPYFYTIVFLMGPFPYLYTIVFLIEINHLNLPEYPCPGISCSRYSLGCHESPWQLQWKTNEWGDWSLWHTRWSRGRKVGRSCRV